MWPNIQPTDVLSSLDKNHRQNSHSAHNINPFLLYHYCCYRFSFDVKKKVFVYPNENVRIKNELIKIKIRRIRCIHQIMACDIVFFLNDFVEWNEASGCIFSHFRWIPWEIANHNFWSVWTERVHLIVL